MVSSQANHTRRGLFRIWLSRPEADRLDAKGRDVLFVLLIVNKIAIRTSQPASVRAGNFGYGREPGAPMQGK